MAADKHDAAMKDASQAVNDIMAQYQKMGLNALTLLGGDLVERLSDLGSEVLEFLTEAGEKRMSSCSTSCCIAGI